MFTVEVPFTFQEDELVFLPEERVPDDHPFWACLSVQVNAVEATPSEESSGCRQKVTGEIDHIDMETLGIDYEHVSLSGRDFESAKLYLETFVKE